jgi:CheY-like chemotaxis protein
VIVTSQPEINVFLAEDNPADVYLVKRALSAAHLHFHLHRASDGEQAIQHLQEAAQETRRFDVILLDLNLPKLSGHEVLSRLRNIELFRTTPVIVITSSDSTDDRAKTAAFGIAHYFRKPSDLQEFIRLGNVVADVCGIVREIAAE